MYRFPSLRVVTRSRMRTASGRRPLRKYAAPKLNKSSPESAGSIETAVSRALIAVATSPLHKSASEQDVCCWVELIERNRLPRQAFSASQRFPCIGRPAKCYRAQVEPTKPDIGGRS